MHRQLWVEPVGRLIIARIRRQPTEDLRREGDYRVFANDSVAAVAWLSTP